MLVPAGTLARTTSNELILVAEGASDSLGRQVGISSTSRGWYEVDAAITEWTPEICRAIQPMLPSAIFAAKTYTAGLTGSDPEVFAFTATNKVIPAWKYLKFGSKDTRGATIYYDGVQAEFTVSADHCHNYVTDHIQAQLVSLQSLLKQYDPTAELCAQDVVRLDTDTLLTSADEHIMLGCSPSKNAYPGVRRIDIGDPRQHPYRYAGTHLHMSVSGYPNKPSWWPDGVVVAMDKICGLLLTALGRDMENPERRKTYGRAGEYRLPGPAHLRLEYRTPGAFLLHHPALFNFAADMARSAYRMGLLMDGRLMDIPDVQAIINECDADAATKLVCKHQEFFKAIWKNQNGYKYNTKATLDTVLGGAKASGRFTGGLAKNWYLTNNSLDWHNHNEQADCKWSTHIT